MTRRAATTATADAEPTSAASGARVLVVARDARVRTSLRHLLGSDAEVAAVDTSGDPEAVRRLLEKGDDVDIVVLDLGPGRRSEDLRLLVDVARRAPVVVLGFDEHHRFEAVAAGAHTYLAKTAAPDELLGAVLRVARTPRGT